MVYSLQPSETFSAQGLIPAVEKHKFTGMIIKIRLVRTRVKSCEWRTAFGAKLFESVKNAITVRVFERLEDLKHLELLNPQKLKKLTIDEGVLSKRFIETF